MPRQRYATLVTLAWYLLGCLSAGAVFGGVWAGTAERPRYVVADDLSAQLPERALAQVIAPDALFVVLTAGLGLAAGIAAWTLFKDLGWWVVAAATLGAGATAIVVWQVGGLVGQDGFAERLANASPGDAVPVDLQLRSMAALLVAPFFAVTPVMLLAAFWPEDGDRPPTAATAPEAVPAD